MNDIRRLILFTRFPQPGQTKTRLIPALGAEGAAALHRRLVLRTLRTAEAACATLAAQLEIRFAGGDDESVRHWLGDGYRFQPQGPGDLGQRMAAAFETSFREGSHATVLIGSDCPELTPETLISAFRHLAQTSAVLGPANDGGYYLVGLARPVADLFREISWGSERVFAQSMNILARCGITPELLAPLSDIDRPSDLPPWQRLENLEDSGDDCLSVIIPALNEEQSISPTLESVRRERPYELIVVDGGSKDGTRAFAERLGAKVITVKPSRARQMNAGAAKATGNVLLFLHADTVLPPGWKDVVSETLNRPGVAAGAFGFRIASRIRGQGLIEWAANQRSGRLQMPYGDQTLFLRRSRFEALGGFANLPIMEDYELVRRLRHHGRIATAEAKALTSARRWIQTGTLRTTLINQLVVAGYHLGVAPAVLARFYRRTRGRSS